MRKYHKNIGHPTGSICEKEKVKYLKQEEIKKHLNNITLINKFPQR